MELSKELYFASTHLSRLLGKQADRFFGPLGLSPSHAFLLMLANNQPGIQPTELSQKLKLTPSTITRLVEKLEYQGYVERQSTGRATHVMPTAKGESMDRDLQEAREELQQSYITILGERYTEVLTEMTTKASEQLKEAD